MDPLTRWYVPIDQLHVFTASLVYCRYFLIPHSLPLGLPRLSKFHLESILRIVLHHAAFQYIICINDSRGLLACNSDKVLRVFIPGTQFGGEALEFVVQDPILREGSE